MSSKKKAKYTVTYKDKESSGCKWNGFHYFSWISQYRFGSSGSVNRNRFKSSIYPSGPSDELEISKTSEFKRHVRPKSNQQSATSSHTQLMLLEDSRFQLFCSLVTFLSIYLYDSCIIANVSDSQNTTIDSILLLISLIFITETVVRLTLEPTYRKSLLMLIDVISLFSVISDLSWLRNSNATLNAVRGVRLAARLGRVLRLLPLLQTIKCRINPQQLQAATSSDDMTTPQTSQYSSKSSKSASETTTTTSSIPRAKRLAMRTSSSLHTSHQTDHSLISSDSINSSSFANCASTSTSSSVDRALLNAAKHVHTRAAAIIALLAVVAPYFIYNTPDTSANAWIESLQFMTTQYSTTSNQLEVIVTKIKKFYDDKPCQLLSVYANGPYLDTPLYAVYLTTHNIIRDGNRAVYSSTYIVNEIAFNTVIELDQTYIAQEQSVRCLGVATIAIFILVLFAWSLTHLLEKYAVLPLNRLVASLKCSAKNIVKNVQAMSKKLLADGADIDGSDIESSEENDAADYCVDYSNDKRLNDRLSVMNGDESFVINPGEVGDEEQWINEDREAVRDLAHTVDKLTNMVTRLFQPVVEIEAGQIDTATEAWLNVNYLRPGQRSSLTPGDDRGPLHYLNSAKARIHLQALAERQTAVSLDLLNSWSFDVLNYSNDQLSEVLTYLFSVHNFFVDFNVPAGSFLAFVNELSSRYIASNTYHNFKHGCDVCHTTHRYLSIARLSGGCMSRLELFSILVAALSHDVGHPGVNNIYLVNSKNDLALRHNDKSPLENMHCSVLYEILAKPATNIFAGLNETQWRESRKIILTAILGTDMVNHFDQITKAQLFLEVNGRETASFSRGDRIDRPECLDEDSNRMFMLELLLHCADISNPCKPFKICEKWSALVAEEFARQGDREKREGLEVSPMMNRDQIVLCNMQLGFIEFVVSPLITTVVKIFPPLSEVGEFMTQNFNLWAERRKQEINDMPQNENGLSQQARLEECRKLDERVAKYLEKMSFLSQLHNAPTRRKNRRSSFTAGGDMGSTSVCDGSPRVTLLNPSPRCTGIRIGSNPQL